LIESWRLAFNSSFVFVAVQLPGYIGDCDTVGQNPSATYSNCVPGVYNMRMAQDAGTAGDSTAALAVTYDLSCSFGSKPPDCPFGSVHNVQKVPVARRIVRQLLRLLNLLAAPEGPRAIAATAVRGDTATSNWSIAVDIHGGVAPYTFRGTQNCAKCCGDIKAAGDFDVSSDGGVTFVNGTTPVAMDGHAAFELSVNLLRPPTHVRYTANQGFPQCALYDSNGLPLYPFQLSVTE
jgi:hypothetical protein